MLEVFTSDKSYYNPPDPVRSRKDATIMTSYHVRNGNYNPWREVYVTQQFLTDYALNNCMGPEVYHLFVMGGILSKNNFYVEFLKFTFFACAVHV